MKRAVFPARNSIVKVPLLPSAPERSDDEPEAFFARRAEMFAALAHVELDIAMIGREMFIGWQHRLALWDANEVRRKRDAEQRGGALPGGLSEEGTREIRDFHRDVIADCVRGVHGIQVGDVDLATVKNGDELASLLDDAGLLADVSRRAREAQSPTPQQLES